MLSGRAIGEPEQFRDWATLAPSSGAGVAHFVTSVAAVYQHASLKNVGAGRVETACGRHFDGPKILFEAGDWRRCADCLGAITQSAVGVDNVGARA